MIKLSPVELAVEFVKKGDLKSCRVMFSCRMSWFVKCALALHCHTPHTVVIYIKIFIICFLFVYQIEKIDDKIEIKLKQTNLFNVQSSESPLYWYLNAVLMLGINLFGQKSRGYCLWPTQSSRTSFFTILVKWVYVDDLC